MAVPEFLKKEGDSLIFNGDGELVFYIPEDYFRADGSMKYAEIAGDYVNSIGFFNYEVFDKNKKSKYGLKLLYFPCVITMMPSDIEKMKGIIINKKVSEEKDYRFLYFRKGDTVIQNINCPQDIANTENLFKIFMITGRIPNTIPYDKLHEYLMDSINYAGADFGVNAQMFGIVISELCRSVNDESKPFRLSKETDMNKYKSLSVKLIPKFISPFTAITSENWDEAVVNACIDSKNDKKRFVDSPMEKILMK